MTSPVGRTEGQRTRWVPLALLLVFATFFPELLSGSTPTLLLLAHPLGGVMLLGLYGFGAVLVWEALARWRQGWLAVLPLGAAYGIAEEGLGTMVFIDPQQQLRIDGIPGAYGSWLGVEWANFVPIVMFHAVVSIGLQLLLVALLFPELKGRSILSRRGSLAVGAGFALDVGLMLLTVNKDPLAPLLPALVFMAALGAGLVWIGRDLRSGWLASWMRSCRPTAGPRAFFFVGFGWLLSLLSVFLLGSHLLPWAVVPILFYVAISAGAFYFLVTRSGWLENRPHQIAFVAGLAGAFLTWDVFLEFVVGDVGVLLVSASLVAIVLWLWSRRVGPTTVARQAMTPSTVVPSP